MGKNCILLVCNFVFVTGISQQPSVKLRLPFRRGGVSAIACKRGGDGLTAKTFLSSNITSLPLLHKGPTATNEELCKLGRLVAVRASLEKAVFKGIKPCLLDRSFVLSGNVTQPP